MSDFASQLSTYLTDRMVWERRIEWRDPYHVLVFTEPHDDNITDWLDECLEFHLFYKETNLE